MVRTVLENQGSEDREGGAAMSKDAERKVTLLNSTVALLKQDVGQLKANEIKLKDRLKKLEEKE
jgi:cell division protein FtsB